MKPLTKIGLSVKQMKTLAIIYLLKMVLDTLDFYNNPMKHKIEQMAWDLIRRMRNVGSDSVTQWNFTLETVKQSSPESLKNEINRAILAVDFAIGELVEIGYMGETDLQKVKEYLIIIYNDIVFKQAEIKAKEYAEWLAEFERTRPEVCPHQPE